VIRVVPDVKSICAFYHGAILTAKTLFAIGSKQLCDIGFGHRLHLILKDLSDQRIFGNACKLLITKMGA
jgi:hypothetical protein